MRNASLDTDGQAVKGADDLSSIAEILIKFPCASDGGFKVHIHQAMDKLMCYCCSVTECRRDFFGSPFSGVQLLEQSRGIPDACNFKVLA
jgi:hypothetical protein